MDFKEILNLMYPNRENNQTEEITEKELFGDDNDIYDYYGENAEYLMKQHYYSNIEKENKVLKEEIQMLQKQIHEQELTIQKFTSELHELKKCKTPAERGDINNEKILDLFEKGFNKNEISNELGYKYNTVKNRLKKLGKI